MFGRDTFRLQVSEMSFLGKIFGKKHDDFDDGSFDTSLPPMPDATTAASQSSSTDFSSTGNPSSGVASFMEKSGDDLTGLPPLDQQHQQPLTAESEQHSSEALTKGQQLAHDFHAQQQSSSQHSPQGVTSSQQDTLPRSLELLNVKLDAIRSELSLISQRLEKLEQNKKW